MSALEASNHEHLDYDGSLQIPGTINNSGFHQVKSQIGSLPSQLQFGTFSSANIQVGSLPNGLSLGQLTGNGNNFDLNSLPASLATYRSERNSLSWEDGSAYESDRPLSRLTLVESPSECLDFEDDGSITCLDDGGSITWQDSPDCLEDAQALGSPGHPYSCEECAEPFSQLDQLRLHEQSHCNSGDAPFQCHISGCVKSFSSKFKLKRHLLIHSQTKTFTCDTCNRAFRRKDHLKNHEKVHDPTKTVYVCSYETCSRTYNSLSSFKKHQALHSAEEGQLDCKICKAILPNQEEVMNHLKMHSSSRVPKGTLDKKFECSQCVKKFPTKKDLKRHSVVHTGQREFACHHCSARFGRKDHMTRHAKKTHPEFFVNSDGNTAAGGVVSDRRLASTPTPVSLGSATTPIKLEAAKNSRKERSISDPGPVQQHAPAALTAASPSGIYRQLVSPSVMLPDFQRLGTTDSNPHHLHHQQQQQSMSSEHNNSAPSYNVEDDNDNKVIYNSNTEYKPNGCFNILTKLKEEVEEPFCYRRTAEQLQHIDPHPPTVSVIVSPRNNQVFQQRPVLHRMAPISPDNMAAMNANIPNRILAAPSSQMEGSYFNFVAATPKQESVDSFYESSQDAMSTSSSSSAAPGPGVVKSEFVAAETVMKDFMDEKDKMDMASYFKDMNSHEIYDKGNFFQNPTLSAIIKDEPKSRPATPSDHTLPPMNKHRHNSGVLTAVTFQPVNSLQPEEQDRFSVSLPNEKYVAKQSLVRTQSQDTITRTKNPVLPSVYTEGTLIVPEPKQMRSFSVHDSFPLNFGDESQQFLTDDDSQSYFQPWNNG